MKQKLKQINYFFQDNLHYCFVVLILINLALGILLCRTNIKATNAIDENKKLSNEIVRLDNCISNADVQIQKLEYDMPYHPEHINWKLDNLAHRLESQDFSKVEWSHVY